MIPNRFLSALFTAALLGATTLMPTSSSAQFLAKYGTDNRAMGIGELTDAQIVEALKTRGRVSMSGTFFETDSTELNSSAPEVLFKLASAMNGHPKLRLAIVGHTDSTGDFDYNIALSNKRAAAVRDLLYSEPYSVAKERLVAVGIGPISPVASNLSEEGRALNRRVTFILLGDNPNQ